VALTASGAVVLAALVLLVVKVKAAGPAPAVDPGDLARARASGAAAAASAPPVSRDPRAFAASEADTARVPERAAPTLSEGPPEQPPDHLAVAAMSGAMDVPEGSGEELVGVEGDAVRSYDSGDYEIARSSAIQVLATDPNNERMLRIATSSSCVLGDADQARIYYQRLTPLGQRQLSRRCKRYGVEL
jgi:hypothetical protein